MPVILLSLLFFWVSVEAAPSVSLRNDREGKSINSDRYHLRVMEKVLNALNGQTIKEAYQEVISETDDKSLCSFSLNQKISDEIFMRTGKRPDLEGVIYYLRSIGEIDDVTVRILLNSDKLMKIKIPSIYEAPESSELSPIETKILDRIVSFEKEYVNNTCLDVAYSNLISDIKSIDRDFKLWNLNRIFILALQDKKISSNTFKLLERSRLSELQKWSLSLSTYASKLKSLRLNYPLTRVDERSDFVSKKSDSTNLSRRQKLLLKYSDYQIIMMGNLVKSLRRRLESPRMEILIYDRENPENLETILLEPMERFRFTKRIFRNEMDLLRINPFFSGTNPDGIDLITASYEIGLIPASELDELASLVNLWNPKKTFWDKAQSWIQVFSSVTTIVVPPPYGYIPILAMIVIEATTNGKNSQNRNDTESLF